MGKRTVLNKAFAQLYWDRFIEKAMSHKYIRKVPNSKGGYYYIYPQDFSKPLKVLLSVFGMKEEKIDESYKNNNIEQSYGVTKQNYAAHILEYLTNRATWNKFFQDKFNRDRFKTPINNKKINSEEKTAKEVEIKNNGKPTDKTPKVTVEKKDGENKTKWNKALMRKIYSMYNTIPEDKKAENAETQVQGDSVSFNGKVGKITKDYGNGYVFVQFDGGGMGRFKKTDLQNLNPTNQEVVNEADVKGTELNQNDTTLNTVNENTITEKEAEKTQNRSEAMMGNDNAKKDFIAEEVNQEVNKIESDKAEFNSLINRLNELNKEFTSNGGYSNRRTTREEDEKRIAAQKEIRVVEKQLAEFRKRIAEENKGSYKIPSVYHDSINEWIKRKVKGQTISGEWLRKKFGGYYSDVLSFGDGYSLSLSDTESINNPSVRINYEDSFKRPGYVVVDLEEMEKKENYRPRYMPQSDDKTFTDVWNKVNELKEQLNNSTGETISEKFFNTVLGISNAYNENSDTSNIPRYRFTKDGIKDKNGKLEKINASVREVGTEDEYIRLYADNYGSSIPSIFYPENDTDIMTDYFEKDSCSVYPDHPYYNHLKVMALKNELYRGRSTKWASMSEEQQKVVENQIKELEKELVEPTEEELKNYRERRDIQEENKEIWKEAKSRVINREMEERRINNEKEKAEKFGELLNQFAEALAKEPPVVLEGLSKQEKIDTLEDRINKLGFEINNLNDENEIESKKQFRQKLQNRLEEVENEPDDGSVETNEPEETEQEKTENRSQAMMGNQNAYKGLSDVELKNRLKDISTEIEQKTNENVKLYEDNSGFMYGASDDPNSDYQKWVKNSSDLRKLKEEIGKITDERISRGVNDEERRKILVEHEAANNGKYVSSVTTVKEAKDNLKELESKIGQGNGYELDKKLANARNNVARAEMDEKDSEDGLSTPIPKIDANVTQRINDNSMSGHGGETYQHDVNVEMKEFRDMFDTSKMNEQQKEYFQERLNSYASLVGSSYGEMASKRLSAGPSWVVAGPAKYNYKRYNQKMDSERRAYETFTEKKDKFIKNTQKRLKELKYIGGAENEEDVKKRVFDDYANGNYSYGDKIDNTDPYAIEKISGKIKFLENAHDVTLMYRKLCQKNKISNVSWTDRTEEEKAKRKEVIAEAVKQAKEKGYSSKVINEGISSPFTANQTADIRRNKERLEELQKRQAVIEERKNTSSDNTTSNNNSGRVDFNGGYVYENPEMDRIQIIYDGKPERDVIDKLKHNGFRWSPSQGAWQRQLNRNGRMAVNRVFAETGVDTKIDIDGAGEVKKSIPLFVIKNGRFLVRK